MPLVHFVVDFYCPKLKLVIKVDGRLHDHPEVSTNDLKRSQKIESYDFQFFTILK